MNEDLTFELIKYRKNPLLMPEACQYTRDTSSVYTEDLIDEGRLHCEGKRRVRKLTISDCPIVGVV